jgi:hypothetical protein
MSYIGNQPSSVAFLTDTFSGTGSQTAYTLSAAPASTSSILVAVSGVLQDPSTYGVTGLTLNLSAAPPSGTGNISVRYLGIPASGVTTTAYRTVTEFTATASQTTFTPPSYTVGFINVYRNGVLLGSADYTATNGTTVVLAVGATSGDLVTIESFQVSSVLNAIPASPASVQTSYLVDSSVTMAKLDSTAQYTGFKNRIINGDMRIDQRNAGASVSSSGYNLDRWTIITSQSSKQTVQQSSVAPTGFTNSLLVTSSSDYSVSSGDFFFLRQRIEGFNVADLGFGTANASTITISFWARSSLTGTFGGALSNSTNNRSYPFSYTISAANTWEQKTLTIIGDTTGTWLTTNGIGIEVRFSLGVGSAFSGTSEAWTNGNLVSVTGATSVVATSGATWQVTGVQLEKGSTATSFDYRPYGTELALCQRYYYATPSDSNLHCNRSYDGGNTYYGTFTYPVTMRATPTISFSGTGASLPSISNPIIATTSTLGAITPNYATCSFVPNSNAGSYTYTLQYNGKVVASVEL